MPGRLPERLTWTSRKEECKTKTFREGPLLGPLEEIGFRPRILQGVVQNEPLADVDSEDGQTR